MITPEQAERLEWAKASSWFWGEIDHLLYTVTPPVDEGLLMSVPKSRPWWRVPLLVVVGVVFMVALAIVGH